MYSLILHGKRSIEFQKWRNLSVSVKLLQNVSSSYSSATAPATVTHQRDGRKGKTFTVSYLVKSLGLSKKLAESISTKVSFEDKSNPDSVLNLLRSHKFTDSQISGIVRSYPRLLTLDAEKSLGPKLHFLQSMKGASSSELTEIVSTVPKILGKKGEKTISVYYGFVRDIIEADKCSTLEKLCLSSSPQGNLENKIRNVSALRGLGVPQRLLFNLLISSYQPVCGKERFEASLKKVVEMGFDPTNPKFVQALHVVYQMSDKTIEEKVDVYKRLGFAVSHVWEIFKKWPFSLKFSEKKITQTFETLKRCGLLDDEVRSVLKRNPQFIRVSEQNIVNSIETFIGLGFSRDDVTLMIKRYPECIGSSAETIKKKTEFFVKKMNWPLESVVSHPQVLNYSMEKRIVPRCNVIKALISKGLLGDEVSEVPPLSSVLACTDQTFLNRYVMKRDKLVPELMAIFTRDNKARLEQ
ncbi:hypothetical protein EUTSA_v10023447mg [Eutrema salsugineum]|uniref:Mitochondrial transcription termination factor family protein n=1 Tax=Eutrema salsugineum TaxID=72664 RepID=V4MDC0_EUTSA|nr:transcription termination factor MTERF2, chloroplastic [Eutrema salsugineum]ESQ29221.1 hypothetical protein EUTSA_v10023447mg [Eutrema salsugineum]